MAFFPVPGGPPAFSAMLVGGLLLIQTALRWWIAYRRWGIRPLPLRRDDSVAAMLGPVFVLALALCVVNVVFYAGLATTSRATVGVVPVLDHPLFGWAGVALMLAASALLFWAQVAMGASWRIGIPARERTVLVREGPFRLSRNPIFLAVNFYAVGVLLAIPNALSAVVVALTAVALSVQVRLEETHLAALHGEAYLVYRRAVRRWL